MNDYNLSDLRRDIVELEKIIKRLQRFIKLNEIISLITDSSEQKEEKQEFTGTMQAMQSMASQSDLSLTDKIREGIKAKGKATTGDIYKFFEDNQWPIGTKVKHSTRGILASMKQRGEIEGSAQDGFSFKEDYIAGRKR